MWCAPIRAPHYSPHGVGLADGWADVNFHGYARNWPGIQPPLQIWRVSRSPLHLFLLIALMLQCSPLCTCNVFACISDPYEVSAVPRLGSAGPTRVCHAASADTPPGDREECFCGGCSVEKGIEGNNVGPSAVRDHLAVFSYVNVIFRPPTLTTLHDRPIQSDDCPPGPHRPLCTPLLFWSRPLSAEATPPRDRLFVFAFRVASRDRTWTSFYRRSTARFGAHPYFPPC